MLSAIPADIPQKPALSLRKSVEALRRFDYEEFLASREYRESRLRKAAVLDVFAGDGVRAAGVVEDLSAALADPVPRANLFFGLAAVSWRSRRAGLA